MLAVFNAGGELITLTPSQVNQGSNKANTIYIVMPLAPTNVLQARFKLPNGKFTKTVITPLAPETGYLGFTDQNGNQLYMWQYDIPSALTTYAGTVTAQFTATNEELVTINEQDTREERVLATFSFEFEVVAGVPPIAVEDIDSYQSIIEALQSINISVISNGNNLQGQINELKETVTTHTNEVNDLETEKQDKEDLDLATRNKTVVGAINELKNELENLPSGGGGGTGGGETPDLSEYVKFTDYATASKAGVVRTNSNYGISASYDGTIAINPANESEIEDQSDAYKPITPKRLSKAVKVGVTANTQTWTDEEKASACETIGAVPTTNKVGYYVYAWTNGKNTHVQYSMNASATSIAQRTLTGGIKVPLTVENEDEATPKKYVDEKITLLNNALEQSEILTVDEITGVLGSRVIAGGADVLNGSDVTLLTVAGQTVFPSQTSQYDCVFSGIRVTDGTTTNEFTFPTIELPYGKKLDFVNKQKITTHKFLQFTGSENWVFDRANNAGYNYYKLELSDMKVGTMQTGKSSKFDFYPSTPYDSPSMQTANTIMFGNNDNCIYLATPSTTVAEVQAETSGTIIAYPLATEIVTAFTSAESNTGNTYTAIAGGAETMTSTAGQTAPATVTAEYVIVNKVGS